MVSGTLYLWARRMGISRTLFNRRLNTKLIQLDHTWVTDYPIADTSTGFTKPILSKDHYWFCWGKFHSANDRNQNPKLCKPFYGPLTADLDEATCICEPNAKKDRGKPSWPHAQIPGFYGLHGVCHQVANRILWSAGVQPDGQRITVKEVRGGRLSWFAYGDYGTGGDWPLPDCGPRAGSPPNAPEDKDTKDTVVEDMVRSSFKEDMDAGKKNALRQLRVDLLKKKDELGNLVWNGKDNRVQFANQFNSAVAETLQIAYSQILGAQDFQTLFRFEYQEGIIPLLVDPEMAEEYKDEEIPPNAMAATT